MRLAVAFGAAAACVGEEEEGEASASENVISNSMLCVGANMAIDLKFGSPIICRDSSGISYSGKKSSSSMETCLWYPPPPPPPPPPLPPERGK